MNMDPIPDDPPNIIFDDTDDDESEDEDLDNDDYNLPDNPEKAMIGEYLLYLRSSTRATNEDVLNILSKLQDIVQWHVDRCLHKIQTKLQEEHDIQLGEFINIEEIRNSVDCSQGLDTIYKQDKYFKEKFNVIQPERIKLGERFVPYGTATVDGNQPIKIKRDEFIYIPISKVLSRWLQNGSFGNVSRVPRRRDDGIIESYMDGTHIENHPYRNRRPNYRLIKLYYDEADMCDAIGSKSCSINKLGMFYWMDQDIAPQHKSQLKFINLAGIVPNPHIHTYGMNAILKHIVKDVKKLENGIQLPNGDTVYATVLIVNGDNLGVQQLCGFRGSFSGRHPCRTCTATMNQVRTMCREDPTLLRTPEEHDRQVEEIENADDRRKEQLRTDYGINGKTELSEIEGLHPLLSIPPDLIHDDFLGICIRTTKLFLREICINAEFITLEQLNQRISEFDYGYTEKSAKPSPISENQIMEASEGFKQTAAQMAQMVTMLPLIISDKVPEGLPALENYLKMLEVILISHADKISQQMLGYLDSCIKEYLETFQAVYHETFTPKQHYLLHRVNAILRHGPLDQYKTMRPEAFHQVFKRIAQCLRTYKNLPLTLARKFQLHQAFILNGNLEREISNGPLKWIPINYTGFQELFPDVRRLRLANWVQINGIKYVSLKCFLATGYSDENLPIFVALHAIVWRDESPLFVCRTVKTVEHNLILMSYEIEINADFVCLTIVDLLSVEVFHGHRWNNKQYIIIKKALGTLH